MYKVFQKDIFDQYDNPARAVAKQFWKNLGYEAQDNPDEFGTDLLVTGKGKKFYCEVEVKTVWHGVTFHFPSLHIPVRKAKFLDKSIKFMVFNNSLTHAAIVGHAAVVNAPVVEVPNHYIKKGERFFDIPAEDLYIVPVLKQNSP
jgi:hypothetical protein